MQTRGAAVETFLLATLLLTGCAEAREERGAPPPAAGAADPAAEAAVRLDTLWIEGMPEEVEHRLYRAPPGFPLPFRTWVPAGLEVREVASGEGEAILFLAAFGELRADAALRLFVPSAQLDANAAERLAREMLSLQGRVRERTVRPAWSRAAFELDEPERVGVSNVGERAGRAFILSYEFPPEFGDGLGPRFGRILEEWRWEPDGPPRLDPRPEAGP
jgi:hypothetical protein